MKHKPPKISITSLILTVTITASIIIYFSSRITSSNVDLLKRRGRLSPDPCKTKEDTSTATDTIQSSFDIPEPADQTVKHSAHTFHNADIYTVMKKIQEWYPINYAFRIPITNRFTGTIPKDLSLNEALNSLVTMTSDTIVFQRIGDQQIVINPVGK